MARRLILVILLSPCMWMPAASLASTILYDVDLAGTDQFSGHRMNVWGTITFDTETNHAVASDMHFHHQGLSPFDPLDYTASLTDFYEGTAWHWHATPTELRYI